MKIQDNENPRRHNQLKKEKLPLMGVFLIGLGFVFLLKRMDLIPDFWAHIIFSWQSLLIFIGTLHLFKSHDRFPGIILIIVGAIFLFPKMIDIPFEIRQFAWPVVLMAIGVLVIFKSRNFTPPRLFNTRREGSFEQDRIEEVAIFGGGKRIITSKTLKGGSISAIFGGLELDLTEADIEGESAVLEVSCIFGGVGIIVNPEWDVQIQVSSILGGFDDKRKLYKREANLVDRKLLIIKGAVIFGGGEVKAY